MRINIMKIYNIYQSINILNINNLVIVFISSCFKKKY